MTNQKGGHLDHIISENWKNSIVHNFQQFAGSDHSLLVAQIEGACSIRVSKTSLGISKTKTFEMNMELLWDGNIDIIKDIEASQFIVKNKNRIEIGRDIS